MTRRPDPAHYGVSRSDVRIPDPPRPTTVRIGRMSERPSSGSLVLPHQVMRPLLEPIRLLTRPGTLYSARLARDASALRAAQALRFSVFNLELNEGLPESMSTGLDADSFD